MTSSYTKQKKKGGNEPWRANERHYCALCNVWMGSDRQSIALHENGKKHREAVEEDLKRRRDEKSKKEKDKKDLESVFAEVNAAVGVSVGSAASNNFGTAKPWEYPAHQHLSAAHRGPTQAVVPPEIQTKKGEMRGNSSDQTHFDSYDTKGTTEAGGSKCG